MNSKSKPKIYFSFFMFTADLKPDDKRYTKVLIKHLKALTQMGYDGYDLHIAAPSAKFDYDGEVASYKNLKQAFVDHGVGNKNFTTNVGSTQLFDPTAPDKEQRKQALRYLKSRVDITLALGGEGSIMSGPFLYPYGAFPLTPSGQPIWSDALLNWMKPRYRAARPIFQELAKYASAKGVQLSLEPVKSWETPPPNMVSEVLDFLDSFEGECGVTIDTAQVIMESQGPAIFKESLTRALEKKQLNYVHISAPDRGAIHDSWTAWDTIVSGLKKNYNGPYLIEVFNAIPPFDSSMRMTRRRFWRPGEDRQKPNQESAYAIAKAALKTLRGQLK